MFATKIDHSIPELKDEDKEFWRGVLDRIGTDKVRELAADLVMSNVIGIVPLTRKRKSLAYLELVKKVKEEHPRQVLDVESW